MDGDNELFIPNDDRIARIIKLLNEAHDALDAGDEDAADALIDEASALSKQSHSGRH